MIGYKETYKGIKYVFMNIDASVLLETCYHYKPNTHQEIDYSKSWFRPHTNEQPAYQRSDAKDEPTPPYPVVQRAVEHFANQVRYKRWENR